MELPVYEAVMPLGFEGNNRACAKRVNLKPNELAYQAEMAAEVTFDSNDIAMTPGTAVLALIDGALGVVKIYMDDLTGQRMAAERQRTWPITSVEPVGRVIEVRWRP